MVINTDSPPVWEDGVAATGDKGNLGDARDYLRALREGKFAVIHTIGGSYSGGLFGLSSDCTDNPFSIALALDSSLKAAGVDASALDPTGRKSREEMEDELAEVTRNAYIAYARRKFASAQRPEGGDCVALPEPYQSLRDHTGDERPDQAHDLFEMRLMLENGGLDASVLDPTGRRSAAEVEREIRRVEKEAEIRSARETLEVVRITGADCLLQYMRDDLKRADVDASALDPTGKRSAAEMEAAIREASREGHLTRARDEYRLIRGIAGTTDLREDEQRMYADLAAAGVGMEALQEVRPGPTPEARPNIGQRTAPPGKGSG